MEYIAPMFLFPSGDAPLSTNAIKYAMLAIGATHLSYLEATSRLPAADNTLQLSNQYRHTALGLLRQARRVPGELAHDAFLAASLLIVDNDVGMMWVIADSRFLPQMFHGESLCATQRRRLPTAGELAICCLARTGAQLWRVKRPAASSLRPCPPVATSSSTA